MWDDGSLRCNERSLALIRGQRTQRSNRKLLAAVEHNTLSRVRLPYPHFGPRLAAGRAKHIAFPILEVQVDGEVNWREFEQGCPHRALRLFVLPPRSPQVNGAVERAQCTHIEEFYQAINSSLQMATVIVNSRNGRKPTTRCASPAHTYLTPVQVLEQWHFEPKSEFATYLLGELNGLIEARTGVSLMDA